MEVCDSFEVWGRIVFFFWGGGDGLRSCVGVHTAGHMERLRDF